MTIEQLRQHHRSAPFRPFVLHLADGRAFSVPHQEFLAVTGGGRTVLLGFPDRDASETIDLLLVTSIEVPDTGTTNGPRRGG